MCGIAGIFNFDTNRNISRDSLKKMADTIAHRGPDGEDFFIDTFIGLVHRRLSIIDLQRQVGENIWAQFVYRFANNRLSVDEVFKEVHKANMAKRDPKTGVFKRRESDGKIIKPEGWVAPNIVRVVEKQLEK